tara:strand:- start:50249 stop:51070 length:822 start_codon:yes stop_codon:yes gene_type:complete
MNIKYCYILGAGKGTRMGEVGKKVPKVIFPLFEKTLLYSQFVFAKELGIKNFFVNAHHLSDKVIDYVEKNKLNIKVIVEEELLGSGGAIHNLIKKENLNEKILVINSDVFLFSKELKKRILNNSSVEHQLFGVKFDEDQKYNSVAWKDDNKFDGITKNYTGYTFSGVSIINLAKINYEEGVLNFFEKVIKKENDNTEFVRLNQYEYWDFGTAEQYIHSCKSLLELKKGELYNFLVRNNIINLFKVENGCYGNGSNLIELEQLTVTQKSILLKH